MLGYVFGAKAGDNGWKELQESWKTITSSEEARDLVRGGFDITRDLVRQGAGILASRVRALQERLVVWFPARPLPTPLKRSAC